MNLRKPACLDTGYTLYTGYYQVGEIEGHQIDTEHICYSVRVIWMVGSSNLRLIPTPVDHNFGGKITATYNN